MLLCPLVTVNLLIIFNTHCDPARPGYAVMTGPVTDKTMDIWSTKGWKGKVFNVKWEETYVLMGVYMCLRTRRERSLM